MAMRKTYSFTLDLEDSALLDSKVTIGSSDSNVVDFSINVKQDGNPVDLTGITVYLNTKTPSGVTKQTACVVRDATLGVVGVLIPPESIEVGVCNAELRLAQGGDIAMTNQFSYTVRNNLLSGGTATQATNTVPAFHQSVFTKGW